MFHSNSLTISAKRCVLSLVLFSFIFLLWTTIRKLELRSPTGHWLISSFDRGPSPTPRPPHELKPFTDIFKSGKIYPISAYYEPNRRAVRIFFLKHINTQPEIFCSLSLSSLLGLVVLNTSRLRTRSRDGSPFQFEALRDFREQYRGYVAYCDLPPYISTNVGDYSLFIQLHMKEASETVELRVQTGRLGLNSDEPKHRISMCISPWFNTNSFGPEFIVEYIELHRRMGATQFVIYLTEEPHPNVKRVLDAYIADGPPSIDGDNRLFEIKLLSWILPIESPFNATWYFAQILCFNDCLHRIGSNSKYILFADLDEVLVPDRSLPARYGPLPTWNDVIDKAEESPWYKSFPTMCFSSYYFPPPTGNNSEEKSMFDRVNATVETYPERKKCMVRPSDVEEVDVHWPKRPPDFRSSEDLATIFHYRICLRDNFDLCSPDTRYAPNHRLAAYRNLTSTATSLQLSIL
ncbi:hypothetical protein CSKR_111867 [Clonorchis sinensis]|uniref:Glycosyltransferase family 92 protein n=1 Tax=Clonorchis sinensis TaxID=79923 RepID=A0A3R7FFY3_CLOSI|nr:hypothetical protein CSKR_111867 [Clonorchis sinensis]